MSLDLEMNQPSGKIIQVGYCIGDSDTKEIIRYPGIWTAIDEPLDERIIKLCHINVDEYNAEKTTLRQAYDTMSKHYITHGCQLNAITWGGGDTQELRDQLGMNDERWVFGRRWQDTKTIMQAYCLAKKIKHRAGLAKSMLKLNMRFDGTKHRADDDAYNTLRVYFRLLDELK